MTAAITAQPAWARATPAVHVPFGGTKGSSLGARGQGRYAVEFFTTVKTAYVQP